MMFIFHLEEKYIINILLMIFIFNIIFIYFLLSNLKLNHLLSKFEFEKNICLSSIFSFKGE